MKHGVGNMEQKIAKIKIGQEVDKYLTGGTSKIGVGEDIKQDWKWVNIMQTVKFPINIVKNGKNII